MILAARETTSTKQWTAPELTTIMSAQEPIAHFSTPVPALCLNSRLGTELEKSVFTLVPSDYCTRAPCLGLTCERCLSTMNQCNRLRLLYSTNVLLPSLSLMPELPILDIIVCFLTTLTSSTIMTMGTEFLRNRNREPRM